MPDTVRLGCAEHRWHDVTPYDAALIVAALTGELLQVATEPDDDVTDEACPLEALDWARDGEMYREHVEARLVGSGAYIRDDETGEVTRVG